MKIEKFFILENYIVRFRILKKKLGIIKLKRLKFSDYNFFRTWEISDEIKTSFNSNSDYYSIFGIKLKLDNIDWHKDYASGFNYPLERFDCIKAIKYSAEGADMKFPWEVSRFYFGISFVQMFLSDKRESHYIKLRSLISDWIEKNSFLYGINWYSAMDVAIRAVNWIISLNFFWKLFSKDEEFLKKISLSLSQHAEYIYSFPLVEKNLTTNHTISEYAGLLFIALSLREHPNSQKWLDKAVKGLEECIRDQVYQDGVDFEGSIPYHRLVLELVAYSTIAALHNGISFSNEYYSKLFKMVEYTAAYIDEKGNAPQIGDNDSGRFLIFNAENNDPYYTESNHSYLLSLSEHLFDHKFRSQCLERDDKLLLLLPKIKKIELEKIKTKGRKTDKSISFEDGGAYILKNKNATLIVPCFPIGQNGKGGHNNLDTGSFTLSIKGEQVLVDPGTATYTRDKKLRDKFRSYTYHNTLFTELDKDIDWEKHSHWGLEKYYDYKINSFRDNRINLDIFFNGDNEKRKREFILEENYLTINDLYNGNFYVRFNFHPDTKISAEGKYKIETENFVITLNNVEGFKILDYHYSPFYDKIIPGKYLLVFSQKFLETEITFIL